MRGQSQRMQSTKPLDIPVSLPSPFSRKIITIMKRILVLLDVSPYAKTASEYARVIAKKLNFSRHFDRVLMGSRSLSHFGIAEAAGGTGNETFGSVGLRRPTDRTTSATKS